MTSPRRSADRCRSDGRGPALLLLTLLLAGAAQAQSSACDQLKATLDQRIQSTGVRGHSLEIVPAAAPVPRDGRAIGNCDGGAYKVVYRRFGDAAAAASPDASAPAAPAPSPRPAPPPPPPPPPPAPAAVPALAPSPTPKAVEKPAEKAVEKVAAKGPEKAAEKAARLAAEAAAAAAPAFDIDAAVTQLRQIALDFEAPAEMTLGETVTVRLVPASEAALVALKGALEGPGGTMPLRRLTAHLSGTGFRVQAGSPRELTADGTARPRWEWQVEPAVAGTHALRAVWAVEFTLDGAPVLRELRTFDQPVSVSEPLLQRVAAWGQAHWPWLLGLLLVPAALFGWAWQRHHSAYDSAGLPRGPKIRL